VVHAEAAQQPHAPRSAGGGRSARFTPKCSLPEYEARQRLLAAAERLSARHLADPLIDEVAGAVLELLEARCNAS
jgi:hypothetical protein